jgi:hypothetical protein
VTAAYRKRMPTIPIRIIADSRVVEYVDAPSDSAIKNPVSGVTRECLAPCPFGSDAALKSIDGTTGGKNASVEVRT